MAVPARKRRATYQDVLDAPEHLVAEILDGELELSPRPRPIHSDAIGALTEEVRGRFHRRGGGGGPPGGWIILVEPEVHLDGDVIVPDVAGWRRERLPAVPRDVAAIDLAPDWVCEVISPSTARIDRVQKRRIYARAGVGHLWHVDPDARTLEAWRLFEGRWLGVGAWGGSEKVRVEPFDAVELLLGRLWGEEDPEPEPSAQP